MDGTLSPRALAIYVHLPFCARKCRYCDFNSRPAPHSQRAQYLGALHLEIAARAGELGRGRSVATVYFGGGTPTIYRGEELADLLTALTEHFQVRRDAEISIEANPESVDTSKLRRLRAAGFNRLSLGAQSLDDAELRMLGRGHSSAEVVRAVGWARESGFANLSLDLIYALPGQKPAAWARTLERALRLRPDHLSAYGLTLEPGTPLAREVKAGELEPVAEDDHLAMRRVTGRMCAEAGLRQYEISNYARPGCECRHNVVYWRNREYVGLGAGACSHLGGVRWQNVSDPGEYARRTLRSEPVLAYQEQLGAEGRLLEHVMLALRLREGLELSGLAAEFGQPRVAELNRRAAGLVSAGLLARRNGRLRLTAAGVPLHSEICQRLV